MSSELDQHWKSVNSCGKGVGSVRANLHGTGKRTDKWQAEQ